MKYRIKTKLDPPKQLTVESRHWRVAQGGGPPSFLLISFFEGGSFLFLIRYFINEVTKTPKTSPTIAFRLLMMTKSSLRAGFERPGALETSFLLVEKSFLKLKTLKKNADPLHKFRFSSNTTLRGRRSWTVAEGFFLITETIGTIL